MSANRFKDLHSTWATFKCITQLLRANLHNSKHESGLFHIWAPAIFDHIENISSIKELLRWSILSPFQLENTN